jgi:hypothetical protein
VPVDDALEALPQRRGAEIHEQTDRKIEKAQIGPNLLCVDWRKPVNRFQFDQQFALDDQVGPKAAVDDFALEMDRHQLLPFDDQASLYERMRERRLLSRFEHSRAQRPVNADPAADHCVGKRIHSHCIFSATSAFSA